MQSVRRTVGKLPEAVPDAEQGARMETMGETRLSKKAALVKREARRITGDANCRAAEVLLASAVVGPNVDRIIRFLGLKYRDPQVCLYGRVARKQGIWKAGRVAAGWFGENGGLELVADALVLDGLFARVRS